MCSYERRRGSPEPIPAGTLITPDHPRWGEFLDRLTGPLGLDVRAGGWNCAGGEDKRHSRRLLVAMGLPPAAVDANLAFFERHGGYCDCEVWMNVESSAVCGDAGDSDPPDGLVRRPLDQAELRIDGW